MAEQQIEKLLTTEHTPVGCTSPEDNAGEVQSFWSHLDVLRLAIIRVVGVLIAALIAFFVAMPSLFDRVILAPTKGDFILYRWIEELSLLLEITPTAENASFGVDLINIHLASQFLTHLTTSFWLALIGCFPYLIYELWRFIRPALYRHEVKSVGTALAGGTALFFVGCAVGYLIVFPLTFRFLATYSVSATITNSITLDSYMSNFLGIIFVMGLSFELPMLCRLLSATGLITRSMLRSYRRHMVVALLLLAALITPSGDPFTLGVVFLPLYLLYEAGICIAHE